MNPPEILCCCWLQHCFFCPLLSVTTSFLYCCCAVSFSELCSDSDLLHTFLFPGTISSLLCITELPNWVFLPSTKTQAYISIVFFKVNIHNIEFRPDLAFLLATKNTNILSGSYIWNWHASRFVEVCFLKKRSKALYPHWSSIYTVKYFPSIYVVPSYFPVLITKEQRSWRFPSSTEVAEHSRPNLYSFSGR